MRINVVECIAGTTLRVTWVSSGTAPSAIDSTLMTGSETVVHNVTAVDSGNGHYYALHPIPNSGAWYVNRWLALVGVNTYESRQLIRATRLEVE